MIKLEEKMSQWQQRNFSDWEQMSFILLSFSFYRNGKSENEGGKKRKSPGTQRLIKRSPIAVKQYSTGRTMTPNQREPNDTPLSRALRNCSKNTNTFPKKHSPGLAGIRVT